MTQGAGTPLAATQQVAGTILVVEDDAANRALLTHLLRSEGFRVDAHEQGESGLAAVESVNPDLVLLDVGLPDLDGLELTRRLRLDPRYVTLPVLLVTGRTLPSDVVAGLNAGADDFITKPFSQPELIARIRSALRLRRALVGMEAAHAVVTALANAVEAKDAQTEHHCERLALLAGRLGRRLDLPPAELDAVTYGALLHDVGKIGVPDAILAKQGPLDEDEWALVRRHPEIGERICAPLRSFGAFGPIIQPPARALGRQRLSGPAAPREDPGRGPDRRPRRRLRRDHPRSTLPGRPNLEQAIEELGRGAGSQFDPELTRLFVDEIARMSGQMPDPPLDTFALFARRLRPVGPGLTAAQGVATAHGA